MDVTPAAVLTEIEAYTETPVVEMIASIVYDEGMHPARARARNAEGWDFNFDAGPDDEPLPIVRLSDTDLDAALDLARTFA
jgi:hypothetical protein